MANIGKPSQPKGDSGRIGGPGSPLNPNSPMYEKEFQAQEQQRKSYEEENPNGPPHKGQSFFSMPQVWGPLAAIAALIGGPSIFSAFNGAGASGAAGAGAAASGGGSVLPAASGYAANAGRVGASMGGFGLGTGTGAGSAAAASEAGFGAPSAINTIAKLFGNNITDQMTNKASNSVMEMFQPKPNVIQPQQQQRGFGMQKQPQAPQQGGNVISPGSPSSPGGNSMGGLNQDLVQKIRGHFAGQSPQSGMSFGRGNTSFGGV